MRVAALVIAWIAAASVARAQDVPAAYAAVSDVRVHFDSEVPGIVLSRADGQGGWTSLGIAPCDLTLPPGPVDLALAYHNHAPTRVPLALDLPDGARLLGHYESRQTLRELGVGILLGTIVGVLIGIAIGVGGFLARTIDVGLGGLIAAGSVGIVGGATGIGLATLDDLATIDVL